MKPLVSQVGSRHVEQLIWIWNCFMKIFPTWVFLFRSWLPFINVWMELYNGDITSCYTQDLHTWVQCCFIRVMQYTGLHSVGNLPLEMIFWMGKGNERVRVTRNFGKIPSLHCRKNSDFFTLVMQTATLLRLAPRVSHVKVCVVLSPPLFLPSLRILTLRMPKSVASIYLLQS